MTKTAREALLVDRDGLRRVVKAYCSVIHATRYAVGEEHFSEDDKARLRYWESVLDWIKAAEGQELVLMSRLPETHSPSSHPRFRLSA
jgi:hypothetical protein